MMHSTSEMVDLGTHIRTSPFARAIYDTAATEVTINAWNDVYATQASAAEIGVYVDGVYQESVRPTANGASTHVVSLPAGDKRVEVVIGGFRGPAVAAVPTVIGPGTWLRSLQFNKPATSVPSTERGVVIIGDSIANGSKLASAVQDAWPRILQQEVSFPVAVVGRGGMALHDLTTLVGTEANFKPRKLAREVIKHNPLLVIFALGYNDAVRNVWSGSSYGTAVATLGNEIKSIIPDAQFIAMSLLEATNKPAGYATIKDYIVNVTGLVGIQAPAITAAELDADGIHPNEAGHVIIADALRPLVVTRSIP